MGRRSHRLALTVPQWFTTWVKTRTLTRGGSGASGSVFVLNPERSDGTLRTDYGRVVAQQQWTQLMVLDVYWLTAKIPMKILACICNTLS
jgi:hypothetical protein